MDDPFAREMTGIPPVAIFAQRRKRRNTHPRRILLNSFGGRLAMLHASRKKRQAFRLKTR
ncbi:MAG: hypothetical protein Q7V17_13485 [Afipia sp.]|nr:hypothetical protein [Afipia sp.]